MRRALGWFAGTVGTLLVLWLAAHVVLPPINPSQPSPKTHASGPCWACHFISASVAVRRR